MRRNHFLGLVFTSLCLWAAATYYLFLHRPVSKGDEASHLESHLDTLEERVRFQFTENQRLLKDLMRLNRQRSAQQFNPGEGAPEARAAKAPGVPEGEGQQPAPQQQRRQPPGGDEDSDLPVDQEGHRPPEAHHGAHGLGPAPAAAPAPAGFQVAAAEPGSNAEGRADALHLAVPSEPVQSAQDRQAEHLRYLAAGGSDGHPAIAVLVLACNRVTVRKSLDQLLAYRPSSDHFPIIVSQDCKHTPTTEALASYGSRISVVQQPDQSEIDVPPKEKKFRGYFNIARHYGWALNQTFFHFNFQTAIIVEDDLDVAPDFFEYFSATLPLIRRDPTLWCVSAWNDNGKAALVNESAADLLYRTDFFPGLGWMLTRELWSELAPKWPASYWDDWVRQPEQRMGRACIRPELSRTHTFGKVGVSNGFFYDKHLKYIKLSDKFVPFTKLDLSYLLKDNYDVEFVRRVYESPVVSYSELRSGSIVVPGPVRIPYHTKDAFKLTAKILGLMDDFRSGVPRTGYRGVVSFMYKGRRVYLAPNANWKAYDPSWS